MIGIKKSFSSVDLVRVFLCGAACAVLITGCSLHEGGTTTLLQRDIRFEKVAVAPFQAVLPGNPADRVVRCPISGATFRACPFSGNPEERIETFFVEGLTPAERYTVIPPREVRGVYRRVSTDSPGASRLEILQRVGKEVGADGIIAGHLFCFRERRGFDYSAEKPASVAFCIHLIRVEDGVSVWKGVFDKTQSSLMENILDILPFLRGGGKWMTADELSQEGIREILQGFPDVRGPDK